jgi:hypothetical protein
VFWFDVPDEMVAPLIFDFEDHVMPAGTPPGLGPFLAWRNACATPSPICTCPASPSAPN